MSKQIVSQVIEYDKNAQAWGRYDDAGNLAHYHDTQGDAVLAALPEELRRWVASYDGNARVLRAAVLIAEEKIKPDAEACGIYHVAGAPRIENGLTYAVEYTVDARAHRCNCPNFQFTRTRCKHIFAAEYLFEQFRATFYPGPRQASLWESAQGYIKSHERDEWPVGAPAVIWENADGTRQATISRAQTDTTASRGEGFVDALYLSISGHALRLRLAIIHYDVLGLNGDDWRWICTSAQYKDWVKAIS